MSATDQLKATEAMQKGEPGWWHISSN
jgi:hypothetical protein